MRWFTIVLVSIVLVSMVPLAAGSDSKTPEPSPSLTPAQVVQIQLAALKQNDSPNPDDGIRTAYRFASPGNRLMTGPEERFIRLVKNPLYRPLLNHRSSEARPIQVRDDRAVQRIKLIDAEGAPAIFVFTLSRQTLEPYKGCWMTDGVERVQPEELPNTQIAALH